MSDLYIILLQNTTLSLSLSPTNCRADLKFGDEKDFNLCRRTSFVMSYPASNADNPYGYK